MFQLWELTTTSHPLGVAQATLPLTLLSTCPSVHPLGTHVGIVPQSTSDLLLAHRVTRFHCVGVAGSVRASCLLPQVVLSEAVTNLLVVVESDISSASNTTAQV